VNELLKRRAEIKSLLLALAAKADAEQDGQFTDDQKAEADRLIKESVEINGKLQKRASDDQLRKQINELGGDLTGETEQGQKAARGTIGSQFTESPVFKGWLKEFAPSGRIADSARVNGPAVPIDAKSLITGLSDTSAGAMIVNDRFPDIVPALRRPLGMRNIVTTGTISVDAIDWVKVNVETNNAAVVAEATSQSDGTKPESTFSFTKTTETVKTIAHWLAATKRSLSDAGQLRTLIDNFLEDGLLQVLEDQMVTGSGIGENMTGLFNISGIQTQAFVTDLVGTYRRAKTLVRTVGRDIPNAYLMNPTDAQTLDLLSDNEKRYYYGGPMTGGVNVLWGLPVVESEAVTAGTAFVGNFKQLVLLDREQTTISVSDSHSDFFVKNLVAILAELRAMFLCRRPKSIVKIALS
jgi:HK97 family phage major capsid protein